MQSGNVLCPSAFRLPLRNNDFTELRIRQEIFDKMNPNWVCAFQLVVSNQGQCVERDERERVRESGADRASERSRKGNTVRHEEDKQCVHCLYGLVNILMKQPQPKSQHRLHSDSHSD